MPSYFDSQQNEGKDEDGRMSNDLEVNDILYAAQPKDKYDFRFFHHRVKFDEALMNPFTVNSPFLASTYLGEIPIFSNTWMASKDDKFGDADTCPTLPFPHDELQDEKKDEGKDDLDDDKSDSKTDESKGYDSKSSYERRRSFDRFDSEKDYK